MFKKKRISNQFVSSLDTYIFHGERCGAADATWTHPTSPMVVDKSVVTVAAHRAAQTAPEFLGANLVTSAKLVDSTGKTAAEVFELAKTKPMLGVFGSSANANPDPYIYNYFYNTYAAAYGKTLSADHVYDTATGNPFQADTTTVPEYGTSISLVRRPDILFGTGAAADGGTYVELIADLPENKDDDPNNDYNPRLVAYQITTTYDMISALQNLAMEMQEIIVESNGKKTARYGDPTIIAGNYEKYIKGIQFYILSQLESKGIQKTVAIIDPKDLGDGTLLHLTQ